MPPAEGGGVNLKERSMNRLRDLLIGLVSLLATVAVVVVAVSAFVLVAYVLARTGQVIGGGLVEARRAPVGCPPRIAIDWPAPPGWAALGTGVAIGWAVRASRGGGAP